MEWTLDFTPTVVVIDGEACHPAMEFAKMTRRSAMAIYDAVKVGNQLGRLRGIKMNRQVFIPVSELERYQFIDSGRYGKMRAYTHRYFPASRVVAQVFTGSLVHRSGADKAMA